MPSASQEYAPGTVVWARCAPYPWWPARVIVPSEAQLRNNDSELQARPGRTLVEFFNDNERCADMANRFVRPYADHPAFRTPSSEYAATVAAACFDAEAHIARTSRGNEPLRSRKEGRAPPREAGAIGAAKVESLDQLSLGETPRRLMPRRAASVHCVRPALYTPESPSLREGSRSEAFGGEAPPRKRPRTEMETPGGREVAVEGLEADTRCGRAAAYAGMDKGMLVQMLLLRDEELRLLWRSR